MDRKDLNKMYGVPDGYFDRLEKTLMSIPSEQPVRHPSESSFGRIKPYLALAASFFLIMAGGSAVLEFSSRSAVESGLSAFENFQLADLMPVTYQDIMYGFEDGFEPETKQEDHIAEYFIENGTTLEQIEYYYEEDY